MEDNELDIIYNYVEAPPGLRTLISSLDLSMDSTKMLIQMWSSKMLSTKFLKTANIHLDKETVEALKAFKPVPAEKKDDAKEQLKHEAPSRELDKNQVEFPRGSQMVPYFSVVDKIKPTVQSLITKCVCQSMNNGDTKETTKKEETANLRAKLYHTLDAKPETMIKNLSMEGLDPQSLSVLSQSEINQVSSLFQVLISKGTSC